MTIRMQQRRATKDQWEQTNPVLADGEIGVDTTTGKIKVGDGSKAWKDLPYNPISQYKSSSDWATTTSSISQGQLCFDNDTAFFKLGDGTSTWSNLDYFKPASIILGEAGAAYDTLGEIQAILQNGYYLDNLADVTLTTTVANNILAWDTTGTSAWKNKAIDSLGIVNTASTTNKVSNAMLTNSTITFGSLTPTALGGTITTLPGITSLAGTAGDNITVGNTTGTSTILGAPVNINSTGSGNTVISGGSGSATISGGTGLTTIGNTTSTTGITGAPVNINTTAGTVNIGNSSANVIVPLLRVTSTTDATTASTTHAFQIGADASNRLVLDSDEIHAYAGSNPGNLKINEDGGTVTIANASAAATTTINGPLVVASNRTAYAPLTFGSSSPILLTTAVAGSVEYDGSFFYATKETTSGRGIIPVNQTFRLTSNVTAFGTAINDFYGANSSINLAGSSVYEIEFFAYFLKSTAGTATFTLTASSAPTQITGYYTGSGITGINVAAAPTTGYTGSAAATTAAFAATGSLTTAVNHAYKFNVTVITNLATTFKLQLTQGAGTATPLTGSYYKVNRISSSQGSFA